MKRACTTTSLAAALAVALGLGLALVATSPARADDDAEARKKELAVLRQRFKQRYADVLRLKNQGKIDETLKGTVAVVRRAYADDPVNPKQAEQADDDEKVMKIGRFLALENRDRLRLYELLAKELEVKPAVVARRNAARHYKQAEPDHYLRNARGHWLTKKQWDKRQEDG